MTAPYSPDPASASARVVDARLVDALAADIGALERHAREVTARLEQVRAVLGAAPIAPAPPVPLAAPGPSAHPAPGPPRHTVPRADVQGRRAAPPRPAVPWWQRDGSISRLLAGMGGAVTLLGVVMLLVLAAQAGFLGPVLRVVGGAVVSTALFVAGWLVRRRPGGTVGGTAMVATACAGWYLVIGAATAYYHWLPMPVGLAGATLVAAAGLVPAVRWNVETLAVGAVVGAMVCAPFVVSHPRELTAFAVALFVGSALAHRSRAWRVLRMVRTVPTALLVAWALLAAGDADRILVVACALVVAVVGTLSAVDAAVRTASDGPVASVAMVLSAAPLLALEPAVGRTPAVVVAGLLAVVYLALAAERARPTHFRVAALLCAGAAVFGASVVATNGTYVAVSCSLAAIAYAAAAHALRERALLWLAGVNVVVAALAGYGLASLDVLDSATATARVDIVQAVSSSAAVLGAVVVTAAVTEAMSVFAGGNRRSVTGVVLSVAALVVMYEATVILVTVGTVLADASGWLAGHALVTVGAMIAATVALSRGLRGGDHARVWLTVGLTVTVATVVKLFVFDLAALSGAWRVAAFLVVGLLLLAAGTHYARAFAAPTETVPAAPGHHESPTRG